MRHLLLTVMLLFVVQTARSQTVEEIKDELISINKALAGKTCSNDTISVISNRAMNVFLADKTGYLSESSDLSFYTNYVTFNTSEGKLTINHNFQKAGGIDEPVKKLPGIGIHVNIANYFASSFLDKEFENEIGISAGYKWLGKVKTKVVGCQRTEISINQKQAMDALRSAILHSLLIEINEKEADFNAAIDSIQLTEVPGQNIDSAKVLLQRNFYEDLKNEVEEKLARLQAEILTKTNNFSLITTGWTSFAAYIPLVFPKYSVAASLNSAFIQKHPYPVYITLSHTRLWESSKKGRLFLTLSGKVVYNNSKESYALNKFDLAEYRNAGGTDTLYVAGLKKVYTGNYKTFFTPSLSARLVYFPPASHVGINVELEQNIGDYNFLNGRLELPIVLINNKKLPAVNFAISVSFFDITDKIKIINKSGSKTLYGVRVGIPFSRLMY